LGSQETANSEGGVLLKGLAGLVDVGEGNLDRSVILGSNQSVGGRAKQKSINICIVCISL
jgi:hypothetical protein